jgi:dihydrolipoamide dehydrogenase
VHVLDRARSARFVDTRTLAIGTGAGERRLSVERFILCASGRARRLACPGAEHALTHGDIWSLPSLPASVAIVGAAATGCQLASVFAAFGARVHLLEVAPRILAAEDELVSREVAAAFARRGIAIATGIGGVERIEQGEGGLRLRYAQGGPRSLSVEAVVSAIGWDGNADELNLAAAGVETTRSYVAVDDALRTSAPHIFAAGDLTGRMMLVQGAVHEGVLAAENAVLGAARSAAHGVVSHGGFTDPEYGAVGPTEARARAAGDCVAATVPYDDLDRGVIDGQTAGACKLLVSRASRRVLGAHIVGEQAVEVVQVVAAAVRAGQRVEDLTDFEFAYPTYTAIVGIAARRIARALGPAGAERPRGAEWEQASAGR